MYTLLSLFDYSGQWSAPFHAAGWNVIQIDVKHSIDILSFTSVEDVFDFGIEDCNGIIAAPPCTDFACSGAQYWPVKDADGRTAKSLELVKQVQRFADLFTPTDPESEEPFFWAVENPVGRMGKLSGLDNPYYFHPCDFAGWLQPTKKDIARLDQIRNKKGFNVTAAENDFVIECNAYTKKTCLWGCFNRNIEKRFIAPVKSAAQGSFTQRLGGKSDKTKELRSVTPAGFAMAFYEANKDYCYNPASY